MFKIHFISEKRMINVLKDIHEVFTEDKEMLWGNRIITSPAELRNEIKCALKRPISFSRKSLTIHKPMSISLYDNIVKNY